MDLDEAVRFATRETQNPSTPEEAIDAALGPTFQAQTTFSLLERLEERNPKPLPMPPVVAGPAETSSGGVVLPFRSQSNSVQARFQAVNWDRVERQSDLTAPTVQAFSVQARFQAVNWDRVSQASRQVAQQNKIVPIRQSESTPKETPTSSVDSFFSDIQW